jgi:hypothetical protein
MNIPLVALASAALLISNSVFAENTPKETPEHKALKTRYQTDVAAATKPIQTRYISQLESLLKTFTQRGDLSAALGVQQELDAEKGPKPEGDATLYHATKTAFIGGTWTWQSTDPGDSSTIQFAGDGTSSHGGRGNTKWEATSNREITITHPTKGKAVIRLGPDSRSFSGTGYNGKPVSGKRMQ